MKFKQTLNKIRFKLPFSCPTLTARQEVKVNVQVTLVAVSHV